MQPFLDHFFFYEQMPAIFRIAGENFGFDTACLCSYPNFFNLILHFIIAAVIVVAIAKPNVRDKSFLALLLIGFSKILDWTQNILTATGETVFWSNNIDIAVESLQFIGIGIILGALFSKLYKTLWE
jgi:hypothetical protein